MSFRTRLQSFAESQQKIQIWYGMGCHNTVTGRVLAVDHDHVDIEAYSHESDGQIHIRRILVPTHLILHIDITSAEANESALDDVQPYQQKSELQDRETHGNELQPPESPRRDLQRRHDLPRREMESLIPQSVPETAHGPESLRGYDVSVWSRFSTAYADRFSRLTAGPGGIYMAVDNNIWSLDASGQASKYLQLRSGELISGLTFAPNGTLYVTTVNGALYKIDGSRKGRVMTQLDGKLTGSDTYWGDIVLGANETIFVSNFSINNDDNDGGIFRVNPNGDYDVLVGGSGKGARGLLMDQEGFLWALEHASGCVVKRSASGQELSRLVVCEPSKFLAAEGYDGNLAVDSLGRLYITAGRAGSVLRLSRDGRVETFLSNLIHPTGIVFGADGTLFVMEAGRPRVMRISALDKADHTASAPIQL